MSDEEANNGTICGCGGRGLHIHKPWWKDLLGLKHEYNDGHRKR